MNKKANWTLAAILGLFGIGFIILPLAGQISKWWIILGIGFLWLAFIANK